MSPFYNLLEGGPNYSKVKLTFIFELIRTFDFFYRVRVPAFTAWLASEIFNLRSKWALHKWNTVWLNLKCFLYLKKSSVTSLSIHCHDTITVMFKVLAFYSQQRYHDQIWIPSSSKSRFQIFKWCDIDHLSNIWPKYILLSS